MHAEAWHDVEWLCRQVWTPARRGPGRSLGRLAESWINRDGTRRAAAGYLRVSRDPLLSAVELCDSVRALALRRRVPSGSGAE